MQIDARVLVDRPRGAGGVVANELDDPGVQFDRVDAAGTVQQRTQDVFARARAEDEHSRKLQ